MAGKGLASMYPVTANTRKCKSDEYYSKITRIIAEVRTTRRRVVT